MHGQGQNQHAEAKISTSSANAKGKTCPRLATPRLQRAHAKAPTRWPCPCQGTNGWGLPTPRHQRVRHAHAKATLDGGSHRRGGQRAPPPPKEVLKHLQVCQEGTHLVLERSPPRIKPSFVGIFSRSFAEVLRIGL